MFLGENEFMLIDREGELEHRCKVYESLQRAHQRPVLKDLTFYLTPSVLPGIAILKEVIENAGGNMVRRRPSVKNILAKKDAQVCEKHTCLKNSSSNLGSNSQISLNSNSKML